MARRPPALRRKTLMLLAAIVVFVTVVLLPCLDWKGGEWIGPDGEAMNCSYFWVAPEIPVENPQSAFFGCDFVFLEQNG